MKLNRKQIEEKQLTITVSDGPNSLGFKTIKFPEEVDTKTGTVTFWTVPSTNKDTLLAQRKFTSSLAVEAPDELDLVLEKLTGKHIRVVAKPFRIIAETGVVGDEEAE